MFFINEICRTENKPRKHKMMPKRETKKRKTDEFENELRKEKEVKDIKVLGANIPRANPDIIQNLINSGILYVGEDNQLHVVDAKENISAPPTK